MSDPFVPFVSEPVRARSSGDAPFRVLVVSQPDAASPGFVPHPGVTTTPSQSPSNPRVASPGIPQALAHGHPPGGPEPQVTLDRDGDRITRISIRCACGQVIQLDCSY